MKVLYAAAYLIYGMSFMAVFLNLPRWYSHFLNVKNQDRIYMLWDVSILFWLVSFFVFGFWPIMKSSGKKTK